MMSSIELVEDKIRWMTMHGCSMYNKGYEAWAKWCDELYDPDVVYHVLGADTVGLDAYRKFNLQWFKAFPDMIISLEDMFVEGYKVVVRYTLTFTHAGEFMGIPATGKKVSLSIIEIAHFHGWPPKLFEGWARSDTLGFVQQLGFTLTPPKGK